MSDTSTVAIVDAPADMAEVLPKATFEKVSTFGTIVAKREEVKPTLSSFKAVEGGLLSAKGALESIQDLPEELDKDAWSAIVAQVTELTQFAQTIIGAVIPDDKDGEALFGQMGQLIASAEIMDIPAEVVAYVQHLCNRWQSVRTVSLGKSGGSRSTGKSGKYPQPVFVTCTAHGHVTTRNRSDRGNLMFQIKEHISAHNDEVPAKLRSRQADDVLDLGMAESVLNLSDGAQIRLALGTGPA